MNIITDPTPSHSPTREGLGQYLNHTKLFFNGYLP